MNEGHFLIMGAGLILIATCLALLRSAKPPPPRKLKGYCPLCNSNLYGEKRVHSWQVEIGKHMVRTYIKGCTDCLGSRFSRKRRCPICDRLVGSNDTILALSDAEKDTNKMAIKGCKSCFPQGF